MRAAKRGNSLLLGAYQALERQVDAGTVSMLPRMEMLDLVVVNGVARGIVTRNLVTGKLETHLGHAVILATGGYGNVYYLSTNAKGSNVTACWRAHKRGALFANPCFTQIHPTCIPVSGDYQSKLTLMSESLRNDGRIWVPRKAGDKRSPDQIPDAERDYYLERRYPSFGNLVPRDVASRNAKAVCDEGRGVGETGLGVYLDFADAITRLGKHVIEERYGNLFEMYQRITDEDPYKVPMRIYPAIHYTMGGLWVDYNLQSTVPGLFVIGEANFSDHGANRLGASALMQGLSDGYFVVPYTVGNYLATAKLGALTDSDADVRNALTAAQQSVEKLLAIKGKRTVDSFHRALGKIVWDDCGMSRTAEGLTAAISKIRQLRDEFWSNLNVPGSGDDLNQSLEKAGRVADFFELAELMCLDARERNESCGGHFREEYQTPEGEAQRDDERYSYVAAWAYKGYGNYPELYKEAARIRVCAPEPEELQIVQIKLKIWRQKSATDRGRFATYQVDANPEMSMLECLDVLNEGLIEQGQEPVSFEHDCREGICGSCGFMINGVAHGPLPATTVCQLTMRHFKEGQELVAGALARESISDYQGSDCGPAFVRPHYRGRRIYLRFHRQRSRWQCDSGVQGSSRCSDGRGRLHRLWRVCGGLPQCFGRALHRREDDSLGSLAARRTGACVAGATHGDADECGRFWRLH